MIPSPAKHTQTKTTQQQIHSHLKKVRVSRFPIVLNEAIQELNSVVVNKHTQSSDPLHKTVNDRTSSEDGASHLENSILKQTAPQELDKVPSKKFYAEVTKRNGDTNELEPLRIMQSATEQYLKEKTIQAGHRAVEGVSQLKRNPTQNYTGCNLKFLPIPQRQPEVSASTTEERKVFHH